MNEISFCPHCGDHHLDNITSTKVYCPMCKRKIRVEFVIMPKCSCCKKGELKPVTVFHGRDETTRQAICSICGYDNGVWKYD